MADRANGLILFEDETAQNLEPLTLTRPVWELRCGLLTLKEKIVAAFPALEGGAHPREYLMKAFGRQLSARQGSGNDLWVNGALLPGPGLSAALSLSQRSAWMRGDRVIALRGKPPAGWQAGTPLHLDGFDKMEAPGDAGRLFEYSWQLVHAMNAEIERDARRLRPLGQIRGVVHGSATVIAQDSIFMAEDSKIAPGAVMDATLGPIIIDGGALIGAHAIIEGPTYLGPRVQVKPLSHIRGSLLGEESRVGGEISVSIIQGYTNKQHGGFLGHSYIGAWCNLGSGTETSNLKNNYSSVKVQMGEKLIDSGELFVGLTMGDHSKSAIGTVFNTGTVVGVGCNIFGPGFPPRFIPSFHWGGAEKLTRYPLLKTLEIAREVLPRRGKTLTDEDEEILRWVFDHRSHPPKMEKT
jgi:UDP-N-acetylglucosamine diphosphorylase/glucosamine-1-phosphate N-acetyltransferase